VVVVGDLVLDVVVAPARAMEAGTDVPGTVRLRQGGSAASTARWLARLGVLTTLICAVGRDAPGRALVRALSDDDVRVLARRVPGARTGRIGVIVEPGGERSFVADRGAADLLELEGLRESTFAVDLLHVPAYSLLGEPLGLAGRRAAELTRRAGGLVSLDLASVGPLMAGGRPAAQALVREIAPDVLFATAAEGSALLGTAEPEGLQRYAGVVVIKRGRHGASVLVAAGNVRFDVLASPLDAVDTTGAGDAFDAGFLAAFLGEPPETRMRPAALRRAAVNGHRAAARQLVRKARELQL
jgi:sugar/nucleoside kinase (ribokinase family)